MTFIKNIDGLSVAEINRELDNGGKFVVFPFCISIIILTFQRSSGIYFVKPGEPTIKYSFGFLLITLLLGWWGIPWGPIYTISALYRIAVGGKDVTQEVVASLNAVEEHKAVIA